MFGNFSTVGKNCGCQIKILLTLSIHNIKIPTTPWYWIGIFWLHWFLSKDYFLPFKHKSKVIVALFCSLLWIRLIDCLISMFFLTCPSLSGAPMTPICNFSQGLGSFTPPRDNFPQELVFFQGNLLRGIDNCLGRARSVVQGPKRSTG